MLALCVVAILEMKDYHKLHLSSEHASDDDKQESDDMICDHPEQHFSSMKDVVSKQLVQRHTVQYV